MISQEVKPTRMELLEVRRKIRLSERGYTLLKMKRDGLIMEFFNILDKAKDIRKKIVDEYRIAENKLAIARAIEGDIGVRSAAFALEKDPEIYVKSKNIMGVVVPTVTATTVKRRVDKRGYGIIGTTPRIDETTDAYERLVDDVIIASELETTLKRLIEEIEKTKRRVNALEFKIIPDLKEIESFIRLRLEEMERENIFRLKRIKLKSAKK